MNMTKRIRRIIYAGLSQDEPTPISGLYAIVEAGLTLTEDDRRQSTPNHAKDTAWKRNVRNVIQSDKGKGWLVVVSKGLYKLGADEHHAAILKSSGLEKLGGSK